MKKVKPNLRKLFNFHTIILVIFVIVVSTLHTHTSEGKLQRLHKHHHNHNHKQHNVVDTVEANDEDAVIADAEIQQRHYDHHQHHNSPQNHHHHHHHHHHHLHYQQGQQQQQRHYDANTPSLEFTTSSSSSITSVSSSSSSPSSPSSSSSVAISSDNEFLIKQQEQPLIHKDEIYYKTKDLAATSSTTSKPSLSIHLMRQQVIHNLKASSSSNSNSTHAETLFHSQRQHTHYSHNSNNNNSNNNIILNSTPLTKPKGSGGIDNKRTNNMATMHSEGLEYKNSNWNLTSRHDDVVVDDDDDDIATKSYKQSVQHQNQTHDAEKPEFDHVRQRPRQNYEDYYSDAEDDEMDDDADADADDDYSEDEADNDGITYDDDNNLSDRSYARITRSKLDDDYVDDEPYRNGINELSMQRDVAPGVLTEQKYLDVGNEKAVQQARERYIQEQKRPRTPHELATEHWHRMIQATKCRKPLPRVIPVSNNTSKRYEPYATILHRCGDDTGCCGSTASVCTVKRHEIVMVYVFSYDFNYRKEIEALPMQNHTECHCVNRGSLLHDSMPRDKRSGGSGSHLHHFQRQQRKQHQQEEHLQSESQSYTQLQFHHQQQLQNMLDCHCPRHFNVFEEDVERHVHLPKPHSVFIRKCRCDCLVNNQTCLRFKHGEEGFSLEDRKCILDRNCKVPVCLYGDYNSRVGRCPSYRSHLLQTT